MQKILDENSKRMSIEQEIANLEKEELDMIQKLQNTQMLQKTAYEDLENALNADDEQLMQS